MTWALNQYVMTKLIPLLIEVVKELEDKFDGQSRLIVEQREKIASLAASDPPRPLHDGDLALGDSQVPSCLGCDAVYYRESTIKRSESAERNPDRNCPEVAAKGYRFGVLFRGHGTTPFTRSGTSTLNGMSKQNWRRQWTFRRPFSRVVYVSRPIVFDAFGGSIVILSHWIQTLADATARSTPAASTKITF